MSGGLVAACFGVTAYFYSTLPARIPTHFNFSGAVDAWAPKNPIMAFLVPMIGLIIYLLFSLIYRHPEYTSWPTTLVLVTLPKEKRDLMFAVLRGMNAWILIWISALFTYVQFLIIATSNERAVGSTTYIMSGILVVCLLIIIVTNIRMISTVYKIKNDK